MQNKTEYILTSLSLTEYRAFRKAFNVLLRAGADRDAATAILVEGVERNRAQREIDARRLSQRDADTAFKFREAK
jgi:hypothetical protein